jgi:hypothetical protein
MKHMNYANTFATGMYADAKDCPPTVDQAPVRVRLEAIAASMNSLACNLSGSLDKVRGCEPVADSAGAVRCPESIEEWLGIIEARLKDAGYTAQQIDERL